MRFGTLAIACATALAFSVVGCAGDVPEEQTASSDAELSIEDICRFFPCEDIFHEGDTSRWVKVGETGDIDGFFPTSHSIDVDRRVGRVSSMQLRVRDGGVKINDIRVYLQNGDDFSPALDGSYREGERSDIVRLPRPSRLDEIVIHAQKNPFWGTGSKVEVWVRR